MQLFLMVAFAFVLSFSAMAEDFTHETAPGLSDIEIGHLRNFVSLANQGLDDWSGFEASNQKGLEAYRYQLAFMTYALALQQYHSVPAYRDLYEDTMDRLIERMLEKPVWEFWEEVSKSSKAYDPDMTEEESGTRDPVGEKNIMYSGHIIHMISLYEMLYRDMGWSEQKALKFVWDESESYEYSYADLIEIIHAEMIAPRMGNTKDMGAMECEPNLVFPECNQHPTLAFMLFDHVHGTDYGIRTTGEFKGFMDRTEMQSAETKRTAAYYMIKQDHTLRFPTGGSGSADGWTGSFMHVWDPKYIESIYAQQRDAYVKVGEEVGDVALTPGSTATLAPAFFATFAMEMGDLKTANAILDYAEWWYEIEHDDNGYRFEYNPKDEKYPAHNTTDKLFAMARSNRPNGLWKMHNEPWDRKSFGHPLLAQVDFPNVLVRQAVWDDESETLLFTLEPVGDVPVFTSFVIENIYTNYLAILEQDGEYLAAIDEHAQVAGVNTRNLDPGQVEIKTTLTGPTQFSLKPMN
jgi:hypothetical protein